MDMNGDETAIPPGADEPVPGHPGPVLDGAAGETASPVELDASGESEAEDDGFSMSAADARLAEANGRFVQLAADFENYRKRMNKEKADLAAAVQEDVIREVLPVVDNLERALAAGADTTVGAPGGGADAVVKGVELTLRLFKAVLARHGVERFEAQGLPFDPHRHEALAQAEQEGLTEDTVLEVLEAGYVMGSRIVRPAKVRVGRPKAAVTQDS